MIREPHRPELPAEDPGLDRLHQLLADRATDHLSDAEWAELQSLLESSPEADPDTFDRVAAWLDTTRIDEQPESSEELPAHLRDRIVADGRMRVRAHRLGVHRDPGATVAPVALPKRGSGAPERSTATDPAPAPSGSGGVLPAVLRLAAAAVIGLTVGIFLVGEGGDGGEAPLSPERAYAALLDRHSAEEITRAPWQGIAGESLAAVTGEVVWCDSDQEGYMRLEGMPVNDPTTEQYQLWIVDPDRGHEQPVDGGVFDVTSADGVQTIAIDAALPVDAPGVFVITLERRGGVPVSDGPFLATASVGG